MRPLILAERGLETPSICLASLLQSGAGTIEGETSLVLADYVREMVVSGFPGFRHLTGRALRAQLDGYLSRIVNRDFKDQGLNVRNPQVSVIFHRIGVLRQFSFVHHVSLLRLVDMI